MPMLMSSMREKTKIVLFIALLAFVGLIFFDWGMQGGGGGGRGPQGGTIAEVNGRKVPYDTYRRTRQAVVAGFEARTGQSPEFSDLDAIEEETWITLVRESVLQEQIERHGIRISDAEILEVLRTNPPPELRAQFTDESGQFDAVAYSQALANPALAAQWANVEGYIRASMPVDKIQNYVGLNARVTSAEIRDRFLARNEKVSVRYVASLAAAVELEEGTIGDADVRAYYDANPAEFRAGERAVLDYVRVSKLPSAADTAAARADLEDLRRQVVEGGADFAEIARTWSEDGSAQRGGDLGLVARGDMVPEFEAVAFATPAGEVSPVFSTPFGFHFVGVDERRSDADGERIRVRHVLLRVEASNRTLRDAANALDDFLEAVADGAAFDAAAGEQGLAVERTPPVENGAAIPGIGLLRGAHAFAFSAEPGQTSTEPVEDDRALYAFRLVERRPAGPIPFEEVAERARAAVERQERRRVARERLASALTTSDGTLASLADALGATVESPAAFTRDSFVPGVGRRNAFVATAFSLAPGERSGIVESERGFHVIEVVERTPADETKLAEERDRIRQELLREERQLLISAWIEKLIADAEVVDYRSGRGVDWKPDASLFAYRPA